MKNLAFLLLLISILQNAFGCQPDIECVPNIYSCDPCCWEKIYVYAIFFGKMFWPLACECCKVCPCAIWFEYYPDSPYGSCEEAVYAYCNAYRDGEECCYEILFKYCCPDG